MRALVTIAALWLAFAGVASAAPVKTSHLEADLVAETTGAAPGSTVYVALRQKIIPHWHTYWRNPGDSGEATAIAWTLPAGWKAGEIVWPAPERFVTGPLMNYVFSDEVMLATPIQVPASAKPGQTVVIAADARWLVCADICVPEEGKLSLSLPVVAGSPTPNPKYGAAIASTLANAPRAAGLKGAWSLTPAGLKLAVTGDAVAGADVSRAYFYPYDGLVIDHAKPQKAERGKNGLTMTLVAGYGFQAPKKPVEIAGVIKLADGKAYEVSALAGPLPAGAAGVTPIAVTMPDSKGGGGASGPGMGILAALGFAFVGGLILNLMPCVFPILSMKAAALARHASEPGAARAQGLAFLGGVIATFLILAGLLIAARAGGQAVGWGFQLQSPGVVAGLALIMLAAALNLSGVFEIGLSAQGAGQNLAGRGDLIGSAFTGALAVIVAAPCTAPFMAGAIGWALVQPPVAALAVFAALGLGLAAPFTALCFWPALFRRLPKPGVWMDTLKKVLAFPMYGAAAWLAWVFAVQTGINALPFLFASAIAVAFAAWAWGASQHAGKPWLPRIVAAAALIAAIPLANAGAAQTAPAAAPPGTEVAAGALPIEPWSPERVAALQAEGKPVFVDFTAAWCVTCQVNERTALAGRKVADAFKTTGAVYLKADWTNRNAEIAKALAEHQREGVPLYLVYGKTGGPVILPQLLSEGLVVEALTKAAGSPA